LKGKNWIREFYDDQEIANKDDTVTTDKFASLSNDLTKYITENFYTSHRFLIIWIN